MMTPRYKTGEASGRFAATLQYMGFSIEVATGYDSIGDRIPFHVYL